MSSSRHDVAGLALASTLALVAATGLALSTFAGRPASRPLVIAHRGDSARAPENTLAAFDSAVRAGADMVELDVHLTRDGQPVVLHDHTVDRTTNGRGRVSDLTLAQVRALDAGGWFGRAFAGERIPTLEEVLVRMKGRAKVLIELKEVESDASAAALVRACHDLIRRLGMTGQTRFQTFYPRNLAALKAQVRDVPFDLLYGVEELSCRAVLYANGERAAGINRRFETLSRADLLLAHGLGMSVFAYTIDGADAFDSAIARGVDGIITNAPAKLAAHLAR